MGVNIQQLGQRFPVFTITIFGGKKIFYTFAPLK
jgi:hypothetical protein